MGSLDAHFDSLYDRKIVKNELNGIEIDPDFKRVVSACFRALLSRFPYLNDHWKRFLIMEYKLNGLQASIDVLKTAVSESPQSLELWNDYLSALLAQYELENAPDPSKTELIRAEFVAGINSVGLNFNSDVIWDKFIGFEEKQGHETPVFGLYLKLIRIPLYQYAAYYKKYSEMCKNYDVGDILDEKDIQEYLEKFEKSSLDDLSLVEKHQIIDAYSYEVFTKTQHQVNEKWPFESEITVPEFSLTNYGIIEKETSKWVGYLDHEIAKYNGIPSEDEKAKNSQFKSTACLFERALVPNCFSGKLWLKYVAFVHSHYQERDEKYASMKNIYDRAISKFVPLDDEHVRKNYVLFLLAFEEHDLANEYLFDMIKTFGGVQNSKIYMKERYLGAVKFLAETWTRIYPKRIERVLEEAIHDFFARNERQKREIKETHKTTSENGLESFKPQYGAILQKLLDNEAISVVISEYLNLLLQKGRANQAKIRTFFNRIYQEKAVSTSVQFWKFYVEYEGYLNHNFVNLKSIMAHIKTHTALPKMVVDAFIDINHELVSANLATLLEENDISYIYESLVLCDNDKAESLILNAYARKRLANNNYIVQELEEAKLAKQRQGVFPSIGREEELMRVLKKHADHPGIMVDAAPEITNTLIGVFTLLEGDDVEVPPLPTFKNVEKASNPV